MNLRCVFPKKKKDYFYNKDLGRKFRNWVGGTKFNLDRKYTPLNLIGLESILFTNALFLTLNKWKAF